MKRVLRKKMKLISTLIIGFIIFMGSLNSDVLKVRAYPLLREIQHELILYKTKHYQQLETEHFIIRYEPEEEAIIDLVAQAAERDYKAVCDMFGYYPKEKTMIIVYHNSENLMKNTNLGQGKPPMGVYFASTIQILSPRLWISEDENMQDIFMNEGPMIHEFTHLVVDDVTKGNYPLWFTEGVALYQEYVQTGYEWGKNASFEGVPYTVEQLAQNFHQLDEILAYKRSFEIVKEIVEDQGFEKINHTLELLGEGKEFDRVHSEVLGTSLQK
ncbi:hypothetical protein QBE52_18890 [Clostridiaceae bacterium 35-E11]